MAHRGPINTEIPDIPLHYRPIGVIAPMRDATPFTVIEGCPHFAISADTLGGELFAQQWWFVDSGSRESSSCFQNGVMLSLVNTDRYIFAVGSIESHLTIDKQSFRLYQAVLAALSARGKNHLHRIWNYLPDINRLDDGVERYQLFNHGRKQAFLTAGCTLGEGAPAACALGTSGGALQIAILAGCKPSVAIENPRQVSSYDYPKQYGAQPPIFSRAAWLKQGSGMDHLFVSGTASIVGHQTLHPFDPLEQTRESLRNIRSVVQSANMKAGTDLWKPENLTGCVYIRHAEDFTIVNRCMLDNGMSGFCYVQADICRSDLSVEIEAEGITFRAT